LKRPSTLIALLGLAACGWAFAESDLANLSATAKKERSRKAVHALFEALPKDGDRAIFEGDLLYSEEALFDYLRGAAPRKDDAPLSEWLDDMKARRPTAGLIDPSGFTDLKAKEKAGAIVYWRDRADRKFKFAIDGASFQGKNAHDRYFTAQKMFVAATHEWEDLCRECGIQFQYDWQSDWKKPRPGSALTFVVRGRDAGGAYVAAAFYPDSPVEERYVNVDSSYYTTRFDQTGVFRHEIGHILGYRHEHLEGVSGCQREEGGWRNLSPYDPSSVMHYACDATASVAFAFSAEDIGAHRLLYMGLASVDADRIAGKTPEAVRSRLERWVASRPR
jgi:hypothetical protein